MDPTCDEKTYIWLRQKTYGHPWEKLCRNGGVSTKFTSGQELFSMPTRFVQLCTATLDACEFRWLSDLSPICWMGN